MAWANLKEYRCPKCGDELTTDTPPEKIKEAYWHYCTNEECDFIITTPKMKQILFTPFHKAKAKKKVAVKRKKIKRIPYWRT